jgi:hypothetical protein
MHEIGSSIGRTGWGLGSLLLAGVASSVLIAPAEALTIVPTYTGSVSASARTAFQFAANEYQNLFTDPVTVNITVATGTTGLGASSTPIAGIFNYAQVRTALINDYNANPSAARTIAMGPGGSINTTTDPSTTGRYFISTAEEKALGLLAGNNPASDGTFTYNRNQPFTFSTTNRMQPGQFDFVGVSEHEISEIMGRIPGLGGSIGGSPGFLPYDLFRYTGAGTRGITNTDGGNFFSIDNGTTNLQGYNNAAANGGDPQDWNGANPTDPYNAFTGTNQGHMISGVDVTAMNVLGWDTQVVPVPKLGTFGTLILAVASLLGFGVLRRRADEA